MRVAPSSARAKAMPFPRPRDAPVMTAILPSRFIIEDDPHGCAFAGVGLFDEQFTAVIFLDDSLGQIQSQSPAAFLGAIACFENIVFPRCFNSAAVIGDI